MWATALSELATIREAEGKPLEALALTTKAVAAVQGSDGDVRLKASVLETHGRVLTSLGRYQEARQALLEARRLNESLEGDGEMRSLLAHSLLSLALVDEQLGDIAEAKASLARAIELFTGYHGADHPNVAIARGRYARLLAESGDADGAWRELDASARPGGGARAVDQRDAARTRGVALRAGAPLGHRSCADPGQRRTRQRRRRPARVGNRRLGPARRPRRDCRASA